MHLPGTRLSGVEPVGRGSPSRGSVRCLAPVGFVLPHRWPTRRIPIRWPRPFRVGVAFVVSCAIEASGRGGGLDGVEGDASHSGDFAIAAARMRPTTTPADAADRRDLSAPMGSVPHGATIRRRPIEASPGHPVPASSAARDVQAPLNRSHLRGVRHRLLFSSAHRPCGMSVPSQAAEPVGTCSTRRRPTGLCGRSRTALHQQFDDAVRVLPSSVASRRALFA